MIEAPLWHLCTCNDDVLSEKTNPDQEIKYVDISNVDSKNGIIGYSRFVFSKAPSRARRLVKTGDIIVSTVRTYLEAIALVDDKYSDCVFSTGFAVLRPKNPNQSLAIYLSLKSSRVISAINAQSKGVAYPSITSSELMRIKVRLPEDTKRVSKLVSDIDNVISNKAKIFDSLSEYRQSLVAHVVTKGLNLHVPLKKTCYDWCEYIPAHWGVTKIGNVFDIVLGKMLCSSPLNESYSEENYLCAGSISWGGVKTDYVKRMWFSPEEKERFLLKDRDIVIVEGGAGFGMATIYRGECSPCYFQNSIVRLRERGMVRSEFCRYWLIVTYGTYLKRICNEATFSHYTKEKVSQTPIIIPPIDEQDRIVEELRVREDLISETLVKINKQIQKIREYRSSLISRLMPES